MTLTKNCDTVKVIPKNRLDITPLKITIYLISTNYTNTILKIIYTQNQTQVFK